MVLLLTPSDVSLHDSMCFLREHLQQRFDVFLNIEYLTVLSRFQERVFPQKHSVNIIFLHFTYAVSRFKNGAPLPSLNH